MVLYFPQGETVPDRFVSLWAGENEKLREDTISMSIGALVFATPLSDAFAWLISSIPPLCLLCTGLSSSSLFGGWGGRGRGEALCLLSSWIQHINL